MRFYYISYLSSEAESKDPSATFNFVNEGEVETLSLQPNTLSPVIDYRGQLPVELFEEMTGPDGVERVPLTTLRFPRQWKGVLFFVIQDASQPGFGFKFYPVEYWGPSIPDGNIRVLNLCHTEMGFQIGDEKAQLASLQRQDLPLSSSGKPLAFRIATHEGERGWRMLVSSVIPPFHSGRVLMITYPASPSGGGVRTLSLTDFPRTDAP